MNEDSKRGTGRTTRMLFAAAQQALRIKSNYNPHVVVVGYSRNATDMLRRMARDWFSDHIFDRMCFISWDQYQKPDVPRSRTSEENIFVDHHCYYEEVQSLERKLAALKAKYSEWDLEEV